MNNDLSNLLKLYRAFVEAGIIADDNLTDDEIRAIFARLMGGVSA